MEKENTANSQLYIRFNGQNYNKNKLTAKNMLEYIETYHPEDKEKFSAAIFENGPVYNHFRTRNIFLKWYFPEAAPKGTKKKYTEDIAVSTFRSWNKQYD